MNVNKKENMSKDHIIEDDKLRIIKIGKEALFEFIYEEFVSNIEKFFDVNALDVTTSFAVDWKDGNFIFVVYKSEDKNGKFVELPIEIDLNSLIKILPDTSNTLYQPNRYCEYTKKELIELLSK